jgi:BON domain
MGRARILPVLFGCIAGAGATLLLDPRSGACRRALARDQIRHLAIQLPRRGRRMLRGFGETCRASAYRMRKLISRRPPRLAVDDAELTHRVQSELGRDPWIRLVGLNFDATDGVVRVRGTVHDVEMANRIIQTTAEVEGVGAVLSLMRTPDGTPAGGTAGDVTLIDAAPRGQLHAEAVRDGLKERWPLLKDEDILASDGHIGRLSARIAEQAGEPQERVRVELEEILLAAT